METRQQRRIREILDGPGDYGDTSLNSQALRHTAPGYVPRTLTPHEWEAWYAQHGVPEAHRPRHPPRGFWARLRRRLFPRARPAASGCARLADEDADF
jgi:hypothetical protein